MIKEVNSQSAPGAIGPYSQATKINGTIYVSGQLPIKEGSLQLEIKAATIASLDNIKHILESEGYTMSDIVKTTVLLSDINNFSKMNEAYAEYFNAPCPARAAFEVAKLPMDAIVEIECIASK